MLSALFSSKLVEAKISLACAVISLKVESAADILEAKDACLSKPVVLPWQLGVVAFGDNLRAATVFAGVEKIK